jgi:Staphylococcal nuclease homologue
MSELVFDKEVELRLHALDRYGRLVCLVFVEGKDAGLELTRRGLCWCYEHYLPEAPADVQQRRRSHTMNWQTRLFTKARLGEDPENTILVSGRLHDSASGRCMCKECSALESTAAIIAELLRPGESRPIAIGPLFLVVKRHRFSSRPVSSSVTGYLVDERPEVTAGRGRGFTLLRR